MYNYFIQVVFFKSGQRIMQYVQGRDPPFELYNFTGADINVSIKTISLRKLDSNISFYYFFFMNMTKKAMPISNILKWLILSTCSFKITLESYTSKCTFALYISK